MRRVVFGMLVVLALFISGCQCSQERAGTVTPETAPQEDAAQGESTPQEIVEKSETGEVAEDAMMNATANSTALREYRQATPEEIAQHTPKPVPEDPDFGLKEFTIVISQGAITPNRIVVNRDEGVLLIVESLDRAYTLGLPVFGADVSASPGNKGTARFIADLPGTFTFSCETGCPDSFTLVVQ